MCYKHFCLKFDSMLHIFRGSQFCFLLAIKSLEQLCSGSLLVQFIVFKDTVTFNLSVQVKWFVVYFMSLCSFDETRPRFYKISSNYILIPERS